MDIKILKNYIYNILYQLVKLVLPVIIVPYTMSHLGESTLGISDFAGNITSWFVLFGALGIATYGNREIAKVRDNREELSRTFFEILSMQIIDMLLILIVFLGYTIFFVKENRTIFLLEIISIISYAMDISWFYYGIEEFKMVSLRNTFVKVLGVTLIMTIVKTPQDLELFVLINCLSDLLGQLITYSSLKKYIHFTKISVKEAYRKHFKIMFILFVPTIAINVYTLLDQTMLGVLIEDKGVVAMYKASQGFVKMFLYFITSIGSVVMPRIANIFHTSRDREEINRYINSTFKISLFLAVPMMFGMIFVSDYFFPWYLPEQPSIINMVKIASPIIIFISLSNVFGIQYLVPTGRNKEYTLSVCAGAAVNFVVNLFLIPLMEGNGAAIGSVAAELVVTLVQYLYIRKEIKIDCMSSFVKYMIAAALMSVVVVITGKTFGVRILSNLLQASLGCLTYFIVLLVLKEDMVKTVITKVKGMVFHG